MVTFSAGINKMRLHINIFKLINIFDLFVNIINYWCSVNKQVVEDIFKSITNI